VKLIRDLLVCCLLVVGITVGIRIDGLVADTDRAVNVAMREIAVSSQALQARLDAVDPLVAKAGKSLDSLDAALKQHKRLAANLDASLNDPEKGVRPTLQNANAVLLQAGLIGGELSRASIEERQTFADNNKKLTETLEESRLLLSDIRARVNDPAVAETQAHLNNSLDAIDKALHPPKQTRGQKVLGFLINTIFGNAVQGFVRR